MRLPKTQRKLKEIASKHGISLATANEVVVSQWECAKEAMMQCDPYEDIFKFIILQHLGKFVVTKQRRWFIQNTIKNRHLNDKRRHAILWPPDRVPGNSETDTSEATEGEGDVAGED